MFFPPFAFSQPCSAGTPAQIGGRMAWPTTSRQSRGYGAAHDRMRRQLIEAVGVCEECHRQGRVEVGTIADHIVPLAKGGTHDRGNYQLLCQACSDAKGLMDKGQSQKPRIGEDGWPIT